MLMTGVLDCEVLSEATKQCTFAAQEVYALLRDAVTKSYQNGSELKPQSADKA